MVLVLLWLGHGVRVRVSIPMHRLRYWWVELPCPHQEGNYQGFLISLLKCGAKGKGGVGLGSCQRSNMKNGDRFFITIHLWCFTDDWVVPCYIYFNLNFLKQSIILLYEAFTQRPIKPLTGQMNVLLKMWVFLLFFFVVFVLFCFCQPSIVHSEKWNECLVYYQCLELWRR